MGSGLHTYWAQCSRIEGSSFRWRGCCSFCQVEAYQLWSLELRVRVLTRAKSPSSRKIFDSGYIAFLYTGRHRKVAL